MRSAEPVPAESFVTLATFQVGETAYALDVCQLREVVRSRPVAPLPRSPRLIEGVIELRGRVVPVVDLGRVLGVGPTSGGPLARIAIVDVDDMLLGLRVDAALEVIRVAFDSLEAPPALALQAGCDTARAIVRRPEAAPLMALSLESVLEAVQRSGADGEEASA